MYKGQQSTIDGFAFFSIRIVFAMVSYEFMHYLHLVEEKHMLFHGQMDFFYCQFYYEETV